jgi:hypothetical protein
LFTTMHIGNVNSIMLNFHTASIEIENLYEVRCRDADFYPE